MSDYIKMDDAIAVINNYIGDDSPYAQWFVRKIRQLDAVSVVLCKDCFLYGECQAAKFYGDYGYCSCGERRKDETN